MHSLHLDILIKLKPISMILARLEGKSSNILFSDGTFLSAFYGYSVLFIFCGAPKMARLPFLRVAIDLIF